MSTLPHTLPDVVQGIWSDSLNLAKPVPSLYFQVGLVVVLRKSFVKLILAYFSRSIGSHRLADCVLSVISC